MMTRNDCKKYETNMVIQKTFPVISMAKDKAIQDLSESKEYTWEKMLVILNPYGIAPLTAMVLFHTEKACKVRFSVLGKTFENGEKGDDVSGVSGMTTMHRVPVFGLYAEWDNEVVLTLLDESENVLAEQKIQITTTPLPSKLQNMIKIVEDKEPTKAGLIFVYGGDTPYPYAFDGQGEIRYYLRRKPRGYGLHPMSGGRFLFADKNVLAPTYENPHSAQIYEMDLFGRTFHIYNVENGMHHDAFEMEPGGDFLAAGSSLRGYTEDTVIEIDRKTGEQKREFDVGTVFDDTYKNRIDYSHVNTVSYNPANNGLLICCRNLHTAAEIDYGTGELKWIICNPKFWKGTEMAKKVLKPVGDVQWHYQSHAIYEIYEDLDGNPDTRHFIIYDNHWQKRRKVKFFDKDPDSYVRIYTVNEKEMTVSMLKNFRSAKCRIRSNGVFMPERDRMMVMSGCLQPPIDGYLGMIYEYAYESEELMRQYATKNSFYRAYELWADYEELEKPMEINDGYMRGCLKALEKIEKPVFEKVRRKPWVFNSKMTTVMSEEKEATRSYDIPKTWRTCKFVRDEAYITVFGREDVLYFRAKDHLIEKIYFVGKEHAYEYDSTNTTQNNLAYFEDMVYCIPLSIDCLKKDDYKIYVRTKNGIFDLKKYIKVQED